MHLEYAFVYSMCKYWSYIASSCLQQRLGRVASTDRRCCPAFVENCWRTTDEIGTVFAVAQTGNWNVWSKMNWIFLT